MKALARGLGVPEIERLSAACAVAWPRAEDFYKSEFGKLFIKYRSLADGHKQELLMMIAIWEREIDRRLL